MIPKLTPRAARYGFKYKCYFKFNRKIIDFFESFWNTFQTQSGPSFKFRCALETGG